ncbi:MAG: subtype B tannase [Alysiella sp.]|uniref:subtype B tannase n=1 Tax=Alysiella sp. TaxID=1872483 RepID=UPI0026DD99A6|nr:subtype B tannase [Alysiella sp.]MDO4434485.1 subtype B tannase [Alysiella sp.]
MKQNKIMSLIVLTALTACSHSTNQNIPIQTSEQKAPVMSPKKTELTQHPIPQNLDFSQLKGETKSFELNGQTVSYRAFENIVYVLNPSDTRYQFMNVYIPEAYFKGESVDGFNAQTAPIFLPNHVGGYMPATASKPQLDRRKQTPNSIMTALSKGYVVASVGARGRTEATGRAPAAILDLKAAVKYLKFNDKNMAGDANKIISNGTSAGGALSALLGTSGNAPEFAPLLREMGAADASDDIFAVSAYCPITNLEHADMAYEWQFNGVNDYEKIQINQLGYDVERKLIKGTQTAEQIQLSGSLKNLFPNYINNLKLHHHTYKTQNNKVVPTKESLTLDKHGNGSFKKYIEHKLLLSAQNVLGYETTSYDKAQIDEVKRATWLKVEKTNLKGDINGMVKSVDFDAYAKSVGRQKTTPAFDGVDLSTGENNLFGDQMIDKKHFTEFGAKHSTVSGSQTADPKIVHMMNAMNFTSKTKYYRIRHGVNDRDTSLAIPTLLALKLENERKEVDFSLPWGQGHGGDYDLEELFAWAKQISSTK